MLELTIKNREVNRLLRSVRLYPARKRAQIIALNERYALKIEASAKKNAPVDTGRLRASIRHVLDAASLSATVLTDLNYAVWQEFGTSKIAAQPFMRPAFEEHIQDYIRELKAILEVA